MLQTVSRLLSELALILMTAVATHLVMSFAQTLMHYKLGHHSMGGKFFRNHINFHHTYYSQDHLVSRTYLTSGFTVVIALMLLVLGLCLLVLLFAVRLMERLGVTEINVVGRVSGVVLAALAVQYIIDGVTDVLGGLPGRMREWMTAAFWR
jgi:MarC family integral membrane protein